MNGRLIKTISLKSNFEKTQIDLKALSNGMYFMKVNSLTTNMTFKLIKN